MKLEYNYMKLVFCLGCILLIVLLTKYKEPFYNSSTPNKKVAICFFVLTLTFA